MSYSYEQRAKDALDTANEQGTDSSIAIELVRALVFALLAIAVAVENTTGGDRG